ncbi:hypothetical protein Q3X32_28050, partial [Pseudomonas sp. DKN 2791]|uniref:hypothetical protein n=1 Tax=Pseudomonas sp. DKN 2791 TaxID=3060956 RepID=UPI0026761709
GYEAVTEVVNEPQQVFVFDRIEYPISGGRLFYMQGMPFPRKGHPFPEAVAANNTVKRFLIEQVRFFAKSPLMWPAFLFGKTLERWMYSFNRLAGLVLRPYRLKDEFYIRSAWEIGKFSAVFFTKLGVSYETASEFGTNFATLIEYDDAYRYII